MYGKIFKSIFDGSLYGHFEATVTFMAMIALADREGIVDMTVEKLVKEIGYPDKVVRTGLAELMKPDPASRTPDLEGRRLVLLHESAGWGWQIVNYAKYRDIRDAAARRDYFKVAKRKQRERDRAKSGAKGPRQSTGVKDSPRQSTGVNRVNPSDVGSDVGSDTPPLPPKGGSGGSVGRVSVTKGQKGKAPKRASSAERNRATVMILTQLREAGVTLNGPKDINVTGWVRDGIPVAEIAEAIKVAKKSNHGILRTGYVNTVLRNPENKRTKGGDGVDWTPDSARAS